MNILFLTKGARGGADMSLLPILLHASKYHKILVVCSANYGFQETLNEEGIDYITINMPTHNLLVEDGFMGMLRFLDRNIRSVLKFPFAVWQLVRVTKKFHADLIYTNDGTLEEGYFASRFLHIRHIWHLREFQDLDFNLKIYGGMSRFKKLLRRNDQNIAITRAIFNHFDLVSQNSVVIYDGVRSAADYLTKPVLAKESYFLFLGKITEGKGCDDLLVAFNKFHKENNRYKLILLGEFTDCSFENWVHHYITDNCLDGFVELNGYVKNVDEIASRAKAIIVPSKFEALGRITAEAMFNRTIVIGRDTAGTKEQMDNAKAISGGDVCLRFSSVEGLVQCMKKIVDIDNSEYVKIVEKAFSAVCKNHSFESFNNQIDMVINAVTHE